MGLAGNLLSKAQKEGPNSVWLLSCRVGAMYNELMEVMSGDQGMKAVELMELWQQACKFAMDSAKMPHRVSLEWKDGTRRTVNVWANDAHTAGKAAARLYMVPSGATTSYTDDPPYVNESWPLFECNGCLDFFTANEIERWIDDSRLCKGCAADSDAGIRH